MREPRIDTCLCCADSFTEISGLYLDNCQFFDSAPWTKDPVAADKLWKLSEELVGQEFKLDVTPVAAA